MRKLEITFIYTGMSGLFIFFMVMKFPERGFMEPDFPVGVDFFS